MEVSRTKQTLAIGNLENGHKLFQACILCHGNRGQGKPILTSSALVGMNGWYIVAHLQKYKDGTRGPHVKDVESESMRPFAHALPDKLAMIDVAAFIQTFQSSGAS
ncbi:MAG: c-type cytochrome [Lentimonas sp.]